MNPPLNKSSFLILLQLLFLTVLSYDVQAQVDSLKRRLEEQLADTVRLSILNAIAFDYRSRDADSTLFFGKQAFNLAHSLGDQKWTNRSMYSQGVGHHIKGDFDSAVFYYQAAIPLAQETKDLRGLSKLYNNLGLVDWNKGDLGAALQYFLNSYEIDEKLNDTSGMVSSLNNIGLVHQNLEEYDISLSYLLRAQVLLETIGDDFRLSQLHNNLGLICQRLGKKEASLAHYRTSLRYAKKANASCYRAHPMAGIAGLLINMQGVEVDSLLFYASESVAISRECGLPKIQSAGLVAMGDTYYISNDLHKAEDSYHEALSLASEHEILASVRDSYRGLYNVYKKQKHWQKALDVFEKFELAKSAIINDEKLTEIALLEAKYSADKEKQALLTKQEKERILYEQQFQQEKTRRNLYLILTSALTVIIVLLLVIYRRERKAIRALRKKNRLISELSNFKSELINMIAHDIKNPLNSIIRLSEQLEKKVGADISKAGQAILRLITNMLDVEKYEEAKPSLTLETIPYSQILEEVALSVELLLHDKSIRLEVALANDAIIKVDKDLITRVFVNLVSNAIKYSPSNGAIQVSSDLVLMGGKEYVKIGVSDYGSGIPMAEQEFIFEKFYQHEVKKLGMTSSTGLGLSFCKMAVNAHDGTISVESEENVGATFWVTLEVAGAIPKEVSARNEQSSLVLSAADKQILKSYSHRLKELKIHKVSAIMQVLDEIEGLNLETRWPNQVRSAVQYSNEVRFEELIKMIL